MTSLISAARVIRECHWHSLMYPSNPVVVCKKTPVGVLFYMEPAPGFEPGTSALRKHCSTAELSRLGAGKGNRTPLRCLGSTYNSHYTIPASQDLLIWRAACPSPGKILIVGLLRFRFFQAPGLRISSKSVSLVKNKKRRNHT